MRADVLEQVFVRPRAGRYTLLLVLEAPSGERPRVTLQAPAGDEQVSMRFLARYLAQEGVTLSSRLRVRRERAGRLEEAPALRDALRSAAERASEGTER